VPKRLPRLFAAPAESPGFLLWQAANRWQQRQRAALAPLGLTPVQFVLLAGVAALTEDDTPPTQARVARHVRADAMMTSQVIRALERRKLVRRVPHPADTRARLLRPTAAGRKLARKAAYVVDDADRAFFESVGADRARLAEALGALAGVGDEPA
jgi:MarR family transcriptional regulator, organic hydroperoxide resistance regulator